MSSPANETPVNGATDSTPVKSRGRGGDADTALRKEIETLKTRLATYENNHNHEQVVKGAEEAMRRQRELESQVDSLRRDMAEILAARATEQKLLEAAETRCTELETQLESGGHGAAGGNSREKEYKQALTQATSELEDLRAQFSHYETQLKNGSEEQEEKIRILETKLRKVSKEANEQCEALEEEKRQRAADAQRIASQERLLNTAAATGPTAGDDLDQCRLALEAREETLRLNIERFEAEQSAAARELEETRIALATEKERSAKFKADLARQSARYDKEIDALKQSLDSARAAPPPATEPDRSAELQDQLDALREQLVTIDGERSTAVKAIEDEHRQSTITIDKIQKEFKARETHYAKQLSEQQEKAATLESAARQAGNQKADFQKTLEAERAASAAALAEARDRERHLVEQLKNARHAQHQLEFDVEKEQARALTTPRLIGLAAVAVVLCAGAFALGSWISKETSSSVTIPDTPPVAAPSFTPSRPALRPTPVATRPVQASRTWPALQVKNIRTRVTGTTMTIVMEYGAFVRKAELSAQARQDLSKLALQLKPVLGTFVLEVEGHTDSDPVGSGLSSGNHNLAQKRAQAAYDYLIKQCDLPATSVTTTSAGEANPPFPNDTPESRKKNRTVVLKLTPAE